MDSDPDTDDDQKIEVYFNSACPVCKAGIEYQKGRVEGCAVAWRDVHADNAAVRDICAELEFVRERLHAVDKDGQLRVGFDAFLVLWRQSPKDRWKARLLGLPLVRQACRVAYNLFAAGLYRWNRAKKHW